VRWIELRPLAGDNHDEIYKKYVRTGLTREACVENEENFDEKRNAFAANQTHTSVKKSDNAVIVDASGEKK
jgi:hypothetical protein